MLSIKALYKGIMNTQSTPFITISFIRAMISMYDILEIYIAYCFTPQRAEQYKGSIFCVQLKLR